MNIHIIACRVFNRSLSLLAARSPNTVDVTFLPQGLHDTPSMLRQMLSDSLEELYRQLDKKLIKHRPDYICLGYGLCSGGVTGIESREIPLVIPRTDDCIAMFLGSEKKYLELFERMNGCYWLNNGWIESCGTLVNQDAGWSKKWLEYAEKYGEDNADYLIEQEKSWIGHYDTCCFINSPAYDCAAYHELARKAARENGWKCEEVAGDERMLKALTDGSFDGEEFLIVPPRHRVEADFMGKKLKAVKIGEN